MVNVVMTALVYLLTMVMSYIFNSAGLFPNEDKKVLSNLREMTEKTVLIVTHRKAALKICDMELRFSEDGIREISLKLL